MYETVEKIHATVETKENLRRQYFKISCALTKGFRLFDMSNKQPDFHIMS